MSVPSKFSSASSSTKKIVNKLEINSVGKIYREVGNHFIYHLSKVSRSLVDSLVDRRSNGGVAGNDVRFIAKHPYMNTDTCGVDNHEIASVLLATVGGVALATSGEVIIIMW